MEWEDSMTAQDVFLWSITLSVCAIGITATLWIVGAISLHAFSVLKRVFKDKEDLDW